MKVSDRTILFLVLLAAVSFNCERDLTSSYNYGSTQSVSLLNPKGGERFTTDEFINVQWTTVNVDDNMRIELVEDDQSVYSINNIPNTGAYTFQIPSEITPSKKYQLKIESILHPEIFDISRTYFEITPLIDGHWYSLKATETTRLELDLELSHFIDDTFRGSGYIHFTYQQFGEPVTYESMDSIGGILSFPVIGFVMREESGKEFNFTGKMINNGEISGRIIGVIDPVYGSLSDSLRLVKQ